MCILFLLDPKKQIFILLILRVKKWVDLVIGNNFGPIRSFFEARTAGLHPSSSIYDESDITNYTNDDEGKKRCHRAHVKLIEKRGKPGVRLYLGGPKRDKKEVDSYYILEHDRYDVALRLLETDFFGESPEIELVMYFGEKELDKPEEILRRYNILGEDEEMKKVMRKKIVMDDKYLIEELFVKGLVEDSSDIIIKSFLEVNEEDPDYFDETRAEGAFITREGRCIEVFAPREKIGEYLDILDHFIIRPFLGVSQSI